MGHPVLFKIILHNEEHYFPQLLLQTILRVIYNNELINYV